MIRRFAGGDVWRGWILVATFAWVPVFASVCRAGDEGETQEGAPLVLGQGEQRLLHVPGLTRFSLGSGVVRAIRPPTGLREDLMLKGVQPGVGDLWVWKSDALPEHRSIRVERVLPDELKPELSRALSPLTETEVLLAGDGVILHGAVRSLGEAFRIAAALRAFPKEVHDETMLDPTLLRQGVERLEEWIHRAGYGAKFQVETSAEAIRVRGAVDDPAERDRIVARLRSVFPLFDDEIGSLPDASPTVHFRVFLLELKKSKFRNLGISWPAEGVPAFRVTTAGIRSLLQLDTTIEALEGEGAAKILSSPELVVRAPGEAELFAGGELPLEMRTHFFSNVIWKTYGLTLKLNVTQATAERVRLDIFTEVSHLDSEVRVDKLPAIQANRLKTQVDARFGVPLLLSGLLQQGIREEAKGLPILKDIPVLGRLFSSEDYMNERSELVAILLPESTPPDPPLDRVARLAPRGFLPIPRNWLSPEDERRLKESPDYPWNALQ